MPQTPNLAQIKEKVESEIDAAIAFAESSPLPDPATTYTDVFKEQL